MQSPAGACSSRIPGRGPPSPEFRRKATAVCDKSRYRGSLSNLPSFRERSLSLPPRRRRIQAGASGMLDSLDNRQFLFELPLWFAGLTTATTVNDDGKRVLVDIRPESLGWCRHGGDNCLLAFTDE